MAADCSYCRSSKPFTTDCALNRSSSRFSYFRSSTAFTTVCAPYFTADGSGLLILSLVNGFHDGLCAVILSRWQCIAHYSACQWLSRLVFAPYCPVDGSVLLILPLVNSFHNGLRAVLPSGWRRIAHSFSRQRISQWFARRSAPQIAAHCSYFRLSTAFTTVCAPYCSADDRRLLTLPLVKAFRNGLRAVLLIGRQRITNTSVRRRLSQWIARHIAQRIASHC